MPYKIRKGNFIFRRSFRNKSSLCIAGCFLCGRHKPSEMLAFRFGAAREREKLVKRVFYRLHFLQQNSHFLQKALNYGTV